MAANIYLRVLTVPRGSIHNLYSQVYICRQLRWSFDHETQTAPFCQMHHRLCSFARVTYSEFGLVFDSKITARYAARVAELESRGHSPSRALSHAPFCHLHPHQTRPQGQYPAVALLCLGRGAHFPQVHRLCGATIVSNSPLRPAAHTTPCLTCC